MQTISVDYLIRAQEQATYFDRQNPGLRQELARVNAELRARNRVDNFYASLAESLNRYGSLTERQNAALKRSLTQYHDRNAQFAAKRAQEAVALTAPVPEGRVTITGTVLSTKWQENDFGGCLKMLVQSQAGWRVWGTVPASLQERNGGLVKGDEITFTATVTRKEEAFGFFSRPSSARFITRLGQAPQLAPVAPAVPAPVAAPVPAPAPAPVAGVARPFLAQLAAR